MRRFVSGWLVAVLVAAFASAAWAGNQEVAERIAQSLRQSGRMQDYKIGVKYQEGTVWLVGRVASEQQLATALNLVMQSPGVERVVNNLSVSQPESDRGEAAHSPATGGSVLRIGAVEDSASESTAVRPVSTSGHPTGLTAAQRLQRAVDSRVRDVQSESARETESVHGMNQADRLPSSFEPVPAQPTSAAQVPLALPNPAQPMPVPQQAPQQAQQQAQPRRAGNPVPVAYTQPQPAAVGAPGMMPGGPRPMYTAAAGGGVAPARYDQPRMPNYAWPSYAPYPNYAAVTYPKQYSPTAWPYIGPFYPYPQVPLGWRKVTLEWDNGWWMLDFKDR